MCCSVKVRWLGISNVQSNVCGIIVSALLVVWMTGSVSAQFIGLRGGMAGNGLHSIAANVSASGQTIVGTFGTEAFVWDFGPPGAGLGRLEGACCSSSASSVSGDGTVVVGTSVSTLSPVVGLTEAYRWTQDTGMVGLGVLRRESDRYASGANDVAADGSVIVGWSTDILAGSEPFIWRANVGMHSLGVLFEGVPEFTRNSANSVSADGTVVVGVVNNRIGYEAFRWTEETGMVGLGDLAGGATLSRAIDVSSSGRVLVGEGTTESGTEAFLWTEQDAMIGLGDLPGGAFASIARAVSSDGKIVLGSGNTDSGETAFIWDEQNGMRDMQMVFEEDFGLNVDGWHLLSATGISDDRRTIVGYGRNPFGENEAWVARIPEPATFLLLILATFCIVLHRNPA